MDPETDFPAAHSMDTVWFAVDRDGHVAVFESGEAGAVPDGAVSEESDVSRESLAAALPDAQYRLVDWLGESREEQHRELPDRGGEGGMGLTLLFLTSLDAARLDFEVFEHAPASEGVAVLFFDLPVETAWRLHEAGLCLGCFPWPRGPYTGLWDDLPRKLGLFHYEHSTDNWIAGPYVRTEPPKRPLHVNQLPPDLREPLGRVRFEALCFGETERIQPVDHAPCSAWDNAYLDMDGQTVRPFPGREDEFDAADWSENPEFRVEMPGQAPPDRPGDPGGG